MKESITVAEATIRLSGKTDVTKVLANCDIIAVEKKATTYMELDVIFPIVRISNVLDDSVTVMRIKARPWFMSQWQQFHREIEPYSSRCKNVVYTYWVDKGADQND